MKKLLLATVVSTVAILPTSANAQSIMEYFQSPNTDYMNAAARLFSAASEPYKSSQTAEVRCTTFFNPYTYTYNSYCR